MTTITATEARQTFFNLLKKTAGQNKIYHITHRQGDVVLMSQDEYEGLLETLDLLSTKGFRQAFETAQAEVASDDTLSFEEVFGEPQ